MVFSIPMPLVTHLRSVAQESEVAEPIELLRAGVVMPRFHRCRVSFTTGRSGQSGAPRDVWYRQRTDAIRQDHCFETEDGAYRLRWHGNWQTKPDKITLALPGRVARGLADDLGIVELEPALTSV